jgi:ubiquitin carboxyl-terminal hydrolase L5
VFIEQTDDVKRRFDYEPFFKEFVRRAFEEGVLEGVLEGLKR